MYLRNKHMYIFRIECKKKYFFDEKSLFGPTLYEKKKINLSQN